MNTDLAADGVIGKPSRSGIHPFFVKALQLIFESNFFRSDVTQSGVVDLELAGAQRHLRIEAERLFLLVD